jgi:hypothetical protein
MAYQHQIKLKYLLLAVALILEKVASFEMGVAKDKATSYVRYS